MHPTQKKILDEQIKIIVSNPAIGDMKKGDLAGVQVHKYKIKTQQYLIAYTYIDNELLLIFINLESSVEHPVECISFCV